MATTAHQDAVLCATNHDAAAAHAVDLHARMAIQVNTRGRARGRRVGRLPAVGQGGVASAVDHYGAIPPSRGGAFDDDVILADRERMVMLSASNSGVRR
jgi:hypothetical protein